MDEEYAQELIEWMDAPGGYRDWYAGHATAPKPTGPHTSGDTGDSGDTRPPPPPPSH